MRITTALLFLTSVVAMAARVNAQEGVSVWDGVYVQEQASGGKVIYDQQCSQCHGADVLKVRSEGPPNLTGPAFKENWDGLTASDLFEYIKKGMPRNKPGHLTSEQVASILAYVFTSNGFPAGQRELPTDAASLKAIRFVAAKPK